MLSQLFKAKNYLTDKNSRHSYIDYFYNDLLQQKRDATRVLEIGVAQGGSILLWRDYFENAVIDAIDCRFCEAIQNQERINHIVANAYTTSMVDSLPIYDIIIDDGPHNLDSMKFFVEHYIHKLKPDGIAIIEDIPRYQRFDFLISIIPSNFAYKTIDLRHIKNTSDDMLLMIYKK